MSVENTGHYSAAEFTRTVKWIENLPLDIKADVVAERCPELLQIVTPLVNPGRRVDPLITLACMRIFSDFSDCLEREKADVNLAHGRKFLQLTEHWGYDEQSYKKKELGFSIVTHPNLFGLFDNKFTRVYDNVREATNIADVEVRIFAVRLVRSHIDKPIIQKLLDTCGIALFTSNGSTLLNSLLENPDLFPYIKNLLGREDFGVIARTVDLLSGYKKSLNETGLDLATESRFGLSAQDFTAVLVESTFVNRLVEKDIHKLLGRFAGSVSVIKQYYDSDKTYADSIWGMHAFLSSCGLIDVPANILDMAVIQKFGLTSFAEKISNGERYYLIENLKKRLGDKKIEDLKEELRSIGERYGIDSSKEIKETLKAVKEKEDPSHPLVERGIARRTGYEIEYNKPVWIDDIPLIMGGLYGLGLKMGRGGGECWEMSPGPFWYPETGNTIFQMMVDSQIIDFSKFVGYTFHFNCDIGRKYGLNELIKGMYLSGAAYEPSLSSNYPDKLKSIPLRIYPNDMRGLDYFESKAFDVMTAHGFRWTYKSASYLSWALSAYQEYNSVYLQSGGLDPIKKLLAGVWSEYEDQLSYGLNSIGYGDYLKERVPKKHWFAVDREISAVYPDIKSRFEDVRYIDGGVVDGRFIKTREVVVGKRKWPNVVAFAQDIAEEAVERVLEITEKVK